MTRCTCHSESIEDNLAFWQEKLDKAQRALHQAKTQVASWELKLAKHRKGYRDGL